MPRRGTIRLRGASSKSVTSVRAESSRAQAMSQIKKKKSHTLLPSSKNALMEEDQVAVIEAAQEKDATPVYQEVARLAYAIWEARGRGDGFSEQDWLEAEQQLREMRSQEPRAFQRNSQAV